MVGVILERGSFNEIRTMLYDLQAKDGGAGERFWYLIFEALEAAFDRGSAHGRALAQQEADAEIDGERPLRGLHS